MERKLMLDVKPDIHPTAFVAPGAVVLGNVTLGEESSVWYNCVLRGDVHYIRVGKRTNIQDLSLVHGMIDRYPVVIGDDVTVGHSAIVHGCVVEDRCLIGMGAKILNGVVVGESSIVAAGSVVREGTVIPARSLVAGIPARIKKTLSDDEVAGMQLYVDNYLHYSRTYKRLLEEGFKL